MLIEFSVENYLSFKTRVTFSMRAADIGEVHPEHVLAPAEDLRLLKSAVLYGANASGKTNLFRAMQFMRRWVLGSATSIEAEAKIPVTRFRLSTATDRAPSRFEVVFLGEGGLYRYRFAVDSTRVHEESLSLAAVVDEPESTLFTRSGSEISIDPRFEEGRGFEAKTRPNALFLSVVAQFNGATALRVSRWFNDLELFLGDDAADLTETWEKLAEPAWKQDIVDFVKRADLSISDIVAEPDEIPPSISVGRHELGAMLTKTVHPKFGEDGQIVGMEQFTTRDESSGTLKFLGLAAPILDCLRRGAVLIIDELDARFHVRLVQAIVELFHSDANRGAQLVFASHGTSILQRRFFRPDQIWFTEKDRFGATDVYSLVEYQLPPDASYERDYIAGKYGAIPFIGDIESLLREPSKS